jgi:MFS family permease
VLVVAIGSATFASLPAFLIGAFAVLIREDLEFGPEGLGAAVSIFFGAAALTSVPFSRVVECIGPRRGMIIGVLGSAATLAGSAAVGRSWWHLAAFLAVGGCALAFAQTSANLALAQGIRAGRQGLAFGAKQSAIPTATLVAGAALPLIGLSLGWRWTFGMVAAAALLFAGVLQARRLPPDMTPARRSEGNVVSAGLLVLAVGSALGMAAGNSLGSFFVESATDGGMAVAAAGVWLAVGSGVSIVARVLWGWLADRRDGRNLVFVATLMCIGAGSYVALALAHTTGVLGVAAVLSFATAWGWPGVLMFAVVRQSRGAAAAATGLVLSGAFIGGTAGPVAFGAIADRISYATAWLTAAGALLSAAVCVTLARRLMVRDNARSATAVATSAFPTS